MRSGGWQLGLIVVLAAGAPGMGCEARDVPQEPAAPVDTASLFADLRFLSHDSLAGRATGTAGNRLARERIVERFEGLGLEPLGDALAVAFAVDARDGEPLEGVNVIGAVRGTDDPGQYMVVTAHYDHVGVRAGEIYNGADDNASGTAALLALAAHFASHPPRHSIVFAALDAEEIGLQGARAFLSAPPVSLGDIALNVNMDMISRSDSVLYVAGTHHSPYLRSYLDPVVRSSGIVLRYGHDAPDLPRGDDWTGSSDHGPFHRLGIPFVYFGVEDHPDYHRPTDDVETINRGFYVEAVESIRLALRSLDENLAEIAARRRGM